jgi:hypothetical protein
MLLGSGLLMEKGMFAVRRSSLFSLLFGKSIMGYLYHGRLPENYVHADRVAQKSRGKLGQVAKLGEGAVLQSSNPHAAAELRRLVTIDCSLVVGCLLGARRSLWRSNGAVPAAPTTCPLRRYHFPVLNFGELTCPRKHVRTVRIAVHLYSSGKIERR